MQIVKQNIGEDLRKRSHRAFELVFREMAPRLYRFALTYVMDEGMAEDFVQDAFMKLWTVAEELPEGIQVEGWLYATVKNACLNYYKHLQVEDSNREKLTEALLFVGNLEYEDCEELYEKMRKCIDGLPEQQRKVLELKVFKNMGYREIAEELGMSEGTVHTHVKRAYRAIREGMPLLWLLLEVLGKRG